MSCLTVSLNFPFNVLSAQSYVCTRHQADCVHTSPSRLYAHVTKLNQIQSAKSSVFVVKRRKMPHLYSTLQGTVVTETFSLVHVHVTILWMRDPVLVLNFTARQFF